MLWYNTETHVLQTNNPAGNIVTDKYMEQFYPEWERVPDSFQPPIIEEKPSKEQLLAELNKEYESSKQALANAYLDAVLHDDSEMAESVKAEITELDEKYDADYSKIEKEV